jgi:uncharacterized protein involved in exopolysaccharide biosynthesis
MGMKNVSQTHDEINLIDYLKTILSYKLFLFIFITLSTLLCMAYNHYSTPIYSTHTVFFINSDDNSSQGGLMSKVSFFTGGSNSSISNYLIALINSKRIKVSLSENLKLKRFKNKNTNEIISELKLYKKVKIRKDAYEVYTLSYENTDPKLAYEVIQEYLRLIPQLNVELDLSPKKDIITILDSPFIPKYPFKPRKLMNLVASTILSFSFGILFIFLHAGFKKSKL